MFPLLHSSDILQQLGPDAALGFFLPGTGSNTGATGASNRDKAGEVSYK